jgi:hypothetical protein
MSMPALRQMGADQPVETKVVTKQATLQADASCSPSRCSWLPGGQLASSCASARRLRRRLASASVPSSGTSSSQGSGWKAECHRAAMAPEPRTSSLQENAAAALPLAPGGTLCAMLWMRSGPR